MPKLSRVRAVRPIQQGKVAERDLSWWSHRSIPTDSDRYAVTLTNPYSDLLRHLDTQAAHIHEEEYAWPDLSKL